MKFDAIKGILGEIAPTIGTALGGPVGGAAASMLADVLGCDPTPQKIEKALAQATPEQLAEIKKAELDFEVRMKELEVDVFALETKDTHTLEIHLKKIGLHELLHLFLLRFLVDTFF